jgi:hypothetical protein
MSTENRNVYLDQVVAQQERLESDLRSKSRSAPAAVLAETPPPAPGRSILPQFGGGRPPGPPPTGSNAVDVRTSGFWRFKTVLVPPNAFVVHTRRGRAEPLHLGLGTSFRYNPATDSYLVVPGALQTILINAFCICSELQGLLVQGYVQWIIQDFATAYRKLDFSDPDDPMRLVNVQLREQAEAAIKDKVATMGVAEVLSDKQPIIEELTTRLRGVAEGEGDSDTGLGLRIVTVQIKEAVVSSSRLWENLQKPFRSTQQRLARLAEVAAEEAIAEREMQAHRQRQSQQLDHDRALAERRADNDAANFDREAAERVRRAERDEQDNRRLADLADGTARHALELEQARHAIEEQASRLRVELELALRKLRLDGELALAAASAQAEHDTALLQLERDRQTAQMRNEQSTESIQTRMIDALPNIVSQLPKPDKHKSVTIGGDQMHSLAAIVGELSAVINALGLSPRQR